MNRLEQINGQFHANNQLVSTETIKIGEKTYPEIVDNQPTKGVKTDYINKSGWGYADSGFAIDKKS
jgi:hypothetical protein